MKKLLIFFLLLLPLNGAAQELLIFGGSNHNVFLGCLNCHKSASSSIWNPYGTYGNKHNNQSIWSVYGSYGGSYGTYSPWNNSSSYPPVVVDRQGNFYGYLTTNEYKEQRAEFPLAQTLYKFWEKIQEDVPYWYDRIFH